MLLFKRKIYFIQKELQSRFILRFVALATLWAVTTVMLFAYIAGKKLDELRYSSHIDLQTTSELLLPIAVMTHVLSLLIFAGLLAYTIHSLWQNLSAPLAAIKRNIERIAKGDLAGSVVLRKKDEFQDLAAEMDLMRRGLQEKIARIKEQQRDLSAAADGLSVSILQKDTSLPHAASLQSAVVQMKETVQAFHC